MTFCNFYSSGGHFGRRRIAAKVLQSGFYWPTLFHDAPHFSLASGHYQHTNALSHHNMLPLSPILNIEIFHVWGNNFMGLFPLSFGFVYICLVLDYLPKWVEDQAVKTNDHKVAV